MAKNKYPPPPLPDSTQLPGFILDLDRRALQAGLRVDRRLDDYRYIDRLITDYHGTKEQIAGSGFIPERCVERFRWPRGRSPSGTGERVFGGAVLGASRVCRNEDGTFRVAVCNECPRNFKRLGDELERYELYSVDKGKAKLESIVHYGSVTALLKAGIGGKECFPDTADEWGWYEGSGEYRVWETSRAPNGWFLHQRYPEAEGKKAASVRVDVADADEYRAFLEDQMIKVTRILLGPRFASVETSQGYRFTISAKAASEAINAIEAAAQCLRSVDVRMEKVETQEAKAEARAQVAASDGDGDFQRFLKQLTEGGRKA